MLIGRMSVNVNLARRRKAQKSTASTTAQNGTKSDERFSRGFQEAGAISKNFKGVEAAKRYC